MKLNIECTYTVYSYDEIELPEGKTEEDILDYYVKWETIHMTFTDGTTAEYGLMGLEHPKCPDDVSISEA